MSFLPLFHSLSVRNVVRLFVLLLLERKVLIHSRHLNLLTAISEAMVMLLFPLQWSTVYIPILPEQRAAIFGAPVPFLIGVHSVFYRAIKVRRLLS